VDHGRDKPFRADQDEMKAGGAFSAKVETGFALRKCGNKNLPSDPFDGRPCNKLLQGIPGAEHA
jgi:hypothetical protein